MLLSALGQLYGAKLQADAMKDSAQAQVQGQRDAIAEQRQAYGDVSPYYEPYAQAGLQGLLGMGGDFTTDMGQFNYDKDVNDFLDPSMQFQQEQMNRALQQSAIANNDVMSGGFAKELAKYNAQLAQTDYGNATNRMNNDKSFVYKQFMDEFNNRANNNILKMNQYQNLANLGQNAVSGLSNLRTGVANNVSQNLQNIGQARGYGAQADGMVYGQAVQNYTSPQNMMALASMGAKLGGM